jgi:hypothetical protein
VNQITEGTLFSSVTFVTGEGLSRKIGTLYGLVAAVLDDDSDRGTGDVDVVLGTTSNTVTRLYPAYFTAAEIGMSHAVIRRAADVSVEWRTHFPHGPDFLPAAAPALSAFFGAAVTTDLHVVAIVPVAHPNGFGADDVPNGKIGEDTRQSFGDAHGSRGTNWLEAITKFVPAAHDAIVGAGTTLESILPKITPSRLIGTRPKKVTVGDDEAERLVDGLDALESRIAGAQATHASATGGGVPEVIDGGMLTGDIANAQYLPAASDAAAASAATRIKVERLAGMMAMFANLDDDQRPGPPKVSASGQIVLDAGSKTDASRAYNEALVAAVEAAAKPEATHYLGRAASVPSDGGYTEYMAACFVHCYYRGTSLLSIGEAARVKTGASVVYHIPHLDAGAEADGLSENTNRANAMLMGEVAQNLSAVVCTVKVNEMFGSYSDILGLLGNIWLQQQVIFEVEPKSVLTLFAEVLGDAICAPHVKRWLLRNLAKKPEVAYAILNYCEQAYLLVSGMSRKRSQTKLVSDGNWDAVDTSAYDQVGELAIAVATKLDAVARGGETFTACAMWENSLRALSIKRAADMKRNAELLQVKHATEQRGRRKDADKERDRDSNPADKKSRREERREATLAKLHASDDQKKGDIVGTGYLQCPTIKGPKQPCGAYYRKGVACAKFASTGKCHGFHVPINSESKENQLLWFDQVASLPNWDFNPDSVTCFEVVAGKFVRPP